MRVAAGRVARWIGPRALLRLAAAGAAGAAAEVAGVALTATAMWLIVRAADAPPIAALSLAVVGVRAFALSRGTAHYVERLTGHDAALTALAALRRRVYEAMARSAGVPEGPRAGDDLTRMVSDVDAVGEVLLRCALPFAVAVTTAAATAALCAFLLPTAGTVLAAAMTLAVLVVPAIAHRRLCAPVAATTRARAELAERCLDLVDGAAELAAYDARDTARDAADAAAGRLARATRRIARVETAAAAATAVVAAGATLTVAGLADAATAHGLAPSTVPVLAIVVLSAFAVAAPLPAAARHLIGASVAVGRLGAVLDAPPATVEPPHPPPLGRAPVTARLHGVRARHRPDRPLALDGVDLCIGPGGRVALVGASGSGKSTVLAVLSRLLEPEAGRYTVDGHDVRELDQDAVRARLAGAAQDAYVFHATLRDNLALARPGADDSELLDAARRARLGDWIAGLPAGLDTVVGQDGATLSGGQRQRLVLARALLTDADVLLLDEPVEAVDPPTASALLAETLETTRGRAVVLVTHTLAGLEEVDEVVVLDGGRVVQRGTHAALLATPGRYRALWAAERAAATAARDRSATSARGADRTLAT